VSYNLLDLRTRVRRKLKDNSYNSGDIDNFLNDTQQEIANLFYWPFLEKTIEGALTIGEHTFEQQSDHQSTFKLLLLHQTDLTNYTDLTKSFLNHQNFFDMYPTPDRNTSGKPSHWTEWGDQLYFNCPVDVAYILRQYYYKLPTDMTSDTDEPDFPQDFREVLVLGAHYRAEEQRDNYDVSGVVEGKFADKLSDLIERYASRQMAGPDMVIHGGYPLIRTGY
jgi:hypothetical protein